MELFETEHISYFLDYNIILEAIQNANNCTIKGGKA
jgi:hypothetical protein